MKKISFLLLAILLKINLFGQLVNIEKERKEYRPGFQGAVSFSFNIIQNTSRILQGSNTTHLQYVYKKHTFLLLNDYTLMKVESDKQNFDLINNNFQHFRYNLSLLDTQKISFETFFQRQQNKIKYLDFRFLAGGGVRFRFVNTNFITIYFAPLFMYENEILSDSLKTTTKMFKGDLVFSISLNIAKTVNLKNVTYYQPALLDFDKNTIFEFEDYRLFSESSLSFKIFKNLEFSMIYELAYDSRPPEELLNIPLFYNFKNTLTYKF